MILNNIKIGDILDTAVLEEVQPRAMEGCFAEVNEAGSINIYLIQDQMPEWLIAFMDHDLQLAYLSLNTIPTLSLKFRHLQLTMPIYNAIPHAKRLTLCSLDFPEMRVNKINRYTLSDTMFQSIKSDVDRLNDRTPSAVYELFDLRDENETNFTIFEQGMRDILTINAS